MKRLQIATERYPDDVGLRVALATELERAGRHEEALGHWERALALVLAQKPVPGLRQNVYQNHVLQIASLNFDTGDCLARLDRLPEAHAAWREVLTLDAPRFQKMAEHRLQYW